MRVNSIYGDGSILPVWPPEFTLGAENDVLQVLDGTGQVVARVGEEVYMGGGEGLSRAMAQCVRQQLPAACTDPYWIVGDGTRPNQQVKGAGRAEIFPDHGGEITREINRKYVRGPLAPANRGAVRRT